VKNTYGTDCFTLMNTGNIPITSTHGLISTCAYGLSENCCTYALEESVAIAGTAVQWLRDNLGIIKTAAETEEMASSVSKEGSSGLFFVPAFNGLFAPHWDMYARGVFIGITRYTKKAHIIHATLEAICYQSLDILEAMMSDLGTRIQELKVDGRASVNNYLMELQANILGAKVIRPVTTEITSLGAAYLAGLAVGF
jgi:glycerol kinase